MYLDTLNKEQLEAVKIINGPELIIAGAGTGKTHTITARVMYMINSGVKPENILLLTFTNKAAKEMKERIIKEVGEKSVDVTAMTFHSFCSMLLKKHGSLLSKLPVWDDILNDRPYENNLDNKFRILSSPETGDILDIVRKSRFDEVNKDLLAVTDELSTAQLALDLINHSATFEFEL